MKKKYAGFLSTFALAAGLLALSVSAEGLDTQIPGAGMAVVLNQYYAETDDPQAEIAAMLEQVSDMETVSETEEDETTSEEESTEAEETEEETDPLMAYYDTIVISQVTDDSYVNVRTEPNTDSEIIGKLYDNCAATIVSEEDGWYKIQSGTVEGYVKASYFVTGDEARELALELGEVVATVTANILNVRADQGTDETWLTILEYGTEVEVLEYGDNWVKVAVDDDLVGWVSADYVDIRVDFDTAISLEEEEQLLAEEAARLQAYEDAMAKLAQQTEETTTEEQTTTAEETTTTAAETTTTTASNSDGVTFTTTSDTIYATANVYIRSGYSTSTSKIAKVTSGTALKRTGIGSNGWDRVYYNGTTCYVYAKYFTTEAPTTTTTQTTTEAEETTTTTTTTTSSDLDDLRAAVVAYALQFVGNPYVYGGTSLTNGTDCSGFTMSVYAHFGITICHSSKGQVNYGIAVNVSESDLLPGDLLFYSNDGSTIGHVALYIGNGQVVHASTAKTGIKISTWNYRTPVAARRLIY
ncbi:MAG: C40 family peptidase [Lachnospiraceae bacterium]|nr:C40 family peptidase [Lachnospiraceae bacterium]